MLSQRCVPAPTKSVRVRTRRRLRCEAGLSRAGLKLSSPAPRGLLGGGVGDSQVKIETQALFSAFLPCGWFLWPHWVPQRAGANVSLLPRKEIMTSGSLCNERSLPTTSETQPRFLLCWVLVQTSCRVDEHVPERSPLSLPSRAVQRGRSSWALREQGSSGSPAKRGHRALGPAACESKCGVSASTLNSPHFPYLLPGSDKP